MGNFASVVSRNIVITRYKGDSMNGCLQIMDVINDNSARNSVMPALVMETVKSYDADTLIRGTVMATTVVSVQLVVALQVVGDAMITIRPGQRGQGQGRS